MLQVVRWFWQVVHGLQQHQQKQLLFFVTGSDRVPIKGLASLTPQFTISRAGPHSDRLPTAHTCFNHLLLPDYQVCLRIPEHKLPYRRHLYLAVKVFLCAGACVVVADANEKGDVQCVSQC